MLNRPRLQSGGILLYGHKGVGKTSAISKIVSLASNQPDETPTNILIINRRLSRTTNDIELYSVLIEEVNARILERKSLLEKMGGALSRLSSVKVYEIELNLTEEQKASQSKYQTWKMILNHLHNVDAVLIALDDAENLSSEALSELKTIVEETSQTPVILVVSGPAEFEENLVQNYYPISREFSGASFDLGAFSSKETKEVLEKPLESAETTKWTQDGIDAVQRYTLGYPYLVQCLASAAYFEGGVLDEKTVESAIPKAVEIGRPWLDHELSGASDQDIIAFAKIGLSKKSALRSSEISALGIAPPYIGRLVRLKILKLVSRGHYKVSKSPMIATFHALKRGLNLG